jgi:hypothetical protein
MAWLLSQPPLWPLLFYAYHSLPGNLTLIHLHVIAVKAGLIHSAFEAALFSATHFRVILALINLQGILIDASGPLPILALILHRRTLPASPPYDRGPPKTLVLSNESDIIFSFKLKKATIFTRSNVNNTQFLTGISNKSCQYAAGVAIQ